MPPTGVARPLKRTITNENDENVGTTRLTRSKAALTGNENAIDRPKKVPTKKATGNTNGAVGATKRRAALGDLSNVVKSDAGPNSKFGKENSDVKEALANKVKAGPLTKAAQPSRVQKTKANTTSRPVLADKTKNADGPELKRPASRSGITGHASKKRHTGSSVKSLKEEEEEDDVQEAENIAPVQNKQTVSASVKVEVKQQVEVKQTPAQEMVLLPEDLDQDDVNDPLMVSEYVHEIFDYLLDLEQTTMPNPDYISQQPDLEWKMRGILIDWLLEVHTRFRLLPETLFLAVNIIDRFLSTKVVQLDRLQLVGVTAMFIAAKYEEVLSPHVTNFRHVADDGFTEEEILSAERFVLGTLDYDLSYPNPMNFLRRISKADNYDLETRTLGKYLLEISCLDHRFLAHPPSQIAAASMYLARLVLARGEWDVTLAHYAGYTAKEIEPVLRLMINYLADPVVHEAFFKKYASKKFIKASIICRKWAKDFRQKFEGIVDVDTTAYAHPALELGSDEADSRTF